MKLLHKGTMDGYWYNPRNGRWRSNESENDDPIPFETAIVAGESNRSFDPPGNPGSDNDWVLVLK